MKLHSIALFIGLSSLAISPLSAQNSDKSDTIRVTKNKEMKTLVNSNFKFKQWGVSVSPIAQFGQMGNQNGIIAQFHINNTWGIGMSMMGSHPKRESLTNSDDLKQKFGGLHLEYTPKANSVLHVSFPLTIGVIKQEKQEISTDPLNYQYTHDHHDDHDDNRYNKSFGLQPGINLEVNLFKYAKLFGGVNYRFAFGKNATNDVQGVSGQFGFKFGMFNKVIKK